MHALAIVWLALAAASPPADAASEVGAAAADDPYLRGARAYRAGRFAEAAEAFAAAAARDPRDGSAIVMEGVTRFRLGQHATARERLARALALPLEADDRALALEYVALIDEAAPPPGGWSFELTGAVGIGVDSNVALTSGDRVDLAGGADVLGSVRHGSPFATASLTAGVERALGSAASTSLAYSFDQNAYWDRQWDDYDFQSHDLDWTTFVSAAELVRLGIVARGELMFTGLGSDYRPFQVSGGGEPTLAVREGPYGETRLSASALFKDALDPSYEYLGGRRLELTLAQDVRLAGWRLSVSGRRRREDLGSSGAVPASYTADMAGLRLTSPLDRLTHVGLRGRIEDRRYDGRNDKTARHDRRYAGTLDLHVGRAVSVGARYDLLVVRASVKKDTSTSVKHVLVVELQAVWF